jgi:hypothetical protein
LITIKNILIFVDSIDVEDSSGSKANVALIQNFVAVGYKVKVLHYTRKDIQLPGITCIAIPEIKTSLFYVLSRTQRVLQRILRINFSSWLENLFGFSFTFFNDSHSIAKAVRNHYNGEDLIISLSKGASFRPHHAMLQLPQLQDKWLAYVHDPYPFHCYPPPYEWFEPGHKQKEAFFRKVSESARYAAFPSLKLQEWMQQFFPAFADKSVIIPHQISQKENNDTGPPNYFDASKFTVLHAGNLLGYRNPFPIVDAYKKFLNTYPEAKINSQLLFLGPSSYHEPKFSEVCDEVQQIFKSSGYVDFYEVTYLQRNVTVNLLLEAAAETSPFLPGKFPHCVQANKPIFYIGPKNSEAIRLLGGDYRYFSTPDNINLMVDIFLDLYLQWKESPKKMRLNRRDLEEYLSIHNLRSVLMEFEYD